MDFTREPIIQTVITPKEGRKIVVRSSKNSGQEEYFVDALEVVSFGSAIFYRSLERPKSFLVPVSDYEVLEVREARMVLKNVGVDRAIKIGGGRDAVVRGGRDHTHEKHEVVSEPEAEISEEANKTEAKTDARLDKKRDRRRNARRRRHGRVCARGTCGMLVLDFVDHLYHCSLLVLLVLGVQGPLRRKLRRGL